VATRFPMKFETFTAGHWHLRYQYRSFEPVPVNHVWTWETPEINTLLESANRALGELNAFSSIVPDVDLFIEMHIAKEAHSSSRIEGTQTSIDEVLLPESRIDPERRNDWLEVRNYVDAINEAVAELRHLPLSNRLLKQAHATLMKGVRGEHKQPGEFRRSQNWIGGSSLSTAAFIPPDHEGVPELMSDLERFWHNEEISVPHLMRLAISHYQFETIHPFLDGNGRIGRLLIPLYLINHGFLAKPSLYLSDFFERNRSSYYDALMRVRSSNDLIHWVCFFLHGIAETATRGSQVFRSILALRTEVESKILSLGRRASLARSALNVLYRRPTVVTEDLRDALGVQRITAYRTLKDLVRLGVIKEVGPANSSRSYLFEDYLRIFLDQKEASLRGG